MRQTTCPYLVQIIFVFIRFTFTQCNNHHFVFTEKEPETQESNSVQL